MLKPNKIEIYPEGLGATKWRWRAIFSDGTIELSPEPYLRKETAKFIARLCYPGVMLLVLK